MSLDQWVSLFSASMSFVGLLFVAVQMRQSTRQRRLESLYRICDVNRELLSLGFSHPELFGVLHDMEGADPVWERHYLQLWLNQLAAIHACLKQGGFDAEFQAGLERDINYFMMQRNMQSHWTKFAGYYPVSFQRLVNGLIEEQAS